MDGKMDIPDEDDQEARRQLASILLERYITENYTEEKVIVVGDLNDDIHESRTSNVFWNFIENSEQFKLSTEYDEQNSDAWFRLASSLNQQSEWDRSAKAAQKSVDLNRNFGGGWYELGLAEMGRGNKIRAKKHFEMAHKDRNWRKLSERKIDEINNPAKYEK